MTRRTIAVAGVIALGLASLLPGVAQAAPQPVGDPGISAAEAASLAAGIPVAPKAKPGTRPAGPNPFLATLPDESTADYSGWAAYLKSQAAAKTAARLRSQGTSVSKKAAAAVVVDEDEPDGTNGGNDSPLYAQPIANFGTGARQNPAIRILGSLDNQAVTPVTRAATPEDDGSIPLAGDTALAGTRRAVTTSATIGDGPHAATTGDFDFYKVAATAGQTITVATATPTGSLDTVVVLYAADGTVVASNDDFGGQVDSRVTFPVPAAGTYYAAVAGYGNVPADPFDPASGDGSGSTGAYTVTISAAAADRDFFAVKLKAGDVLGASVKGSAAYLTVYDNVPTEVHGSDQDASYIYPLESPLPGGGNAATDHVATRTGWHYVGVAQGSGSYDITVEAYRPTLEGNTPPVQKLYLDFDGQRVNTGIFQGTGNVTLSPFGAFLAQWGIPRVQEDEVIDAIVAGVEESIEHDLIESGLNGKFKVEVLNSKDDDDPWGDENVSRVIVGGTIAESGVSTIGIAQSIDPGNFETEETALVLQDVLSAPAGPSSSLNTYLTPASDRIAFVAQAQANVISHEAGHFFGNFHTDNQSEDINLQDAGGANFQNLYGVGPDGVGGTADDLDVDFGHDTFSPAEGFQGTEDTLGRIVFGLTS